MKSRVNPARSDIFLHRYGLPKHRGLAPPPFQFRYLTFFFYFLKLLSGINKFVPFYDGIFSTKYEYMVKANTYQ